MRVHWLKTWLEPFRRMADGVKTYEVRPNDRDFQIGDFLQLMEWSPGMKYTGRTIIAEVTYMTEGGSWGLPDDLCVLAVSVLTDSAATMVRNHGEEVKP